MNYQRLSVEKALESLQRFPRLSAQAVLKSYAVEIEPTYPVSPECLLHLWIADELYGYGPDKCEFVLSVIRSRFPKWVRVISNIGDFGMLQLIFTDNRYFAYTGASLFYDLETGSEVIPKRPPAVSVAYNLAEIFARRYHQAAHADEHPATTMDGS